MIKSTHEGFVVVTGEQFAPCSFLQRVATQQFCYFILRFLSFYLFFPKEVAKFVAIKQF